MDSDIDISNAKLMWAPDTNRSTKMDAFRETVNRKFGLKLGNYQELYKWSVSNYAEFWEECLQFLPIRYSKPWQQVVDKSKSIEEVPEWFQGCHMNFAENMLQYNDDRIAVYAAVEGREQVKKITHRELRDRVALYASAMKKMGIKKNDRIVGYISNCVEALEAMLAASSLGAIWSSTSPDFGVSGVLDRFTQIQPKLIFSVDCVVYNGRVHNHLEKLQHVVQGLPDLEKVVVISGLTHGDNKPDISSILNSCHLEDFLNQDGTVPELEFEQLPFSHPLYIMYSSGTTGAPKCMVHSAGGTLLQQLKEHVIHGNLTRDDVIMYYTTTGWMMWNWLVAALAGGASIVLYDGSPLVLSANVLWDLVDKIGISILGTGAKWLAVLEDKGVKPIETHSLKSLHTILSTGSPLKPLTYEYVYRDIKKDLLLGSITGGTDIISCFAGQNCTLPVYRGEIQARNLGMAVECWNEDGKPVFGESGELVCTKPFPSMPTYFWNDEDGLKYKKAYFDKFKDML
ncbi:acetoacetyl-CoA synthetase [Lingula anatina]|uniref:Acetoacetyl-CoA synthetase n=1 Tax=Lingula anatina TaxID=7574 RepID=A0A1S3IYZ6_LINAN|nr:acetoacetyl-CoA synthetase [Lingula anatina]|eukprot:XP_013403238.1 acetoacetyl-CoA synthetase [Lingula anatina]